MSDRPAAIVGVALPCLAAVVAAFLEVLLTPLYVGSVIVPVCIVAAVVSNVAFVVLAFRSAESIPVAALPTLLWVVVVLGLSATGPGGDVLLSTGGHGQSAVTYGFIASGLVAGTITVVRMAGQLPARR